MSKSNALDKIMCENQKKIRKYGNKRYFYINPHQKDYLVIEFTACYGKLMLLWQANERALTSFTVSHAYR